jgi:hypothetical protein
MRTRKLFNFSHLIEYRTPGKMYALVQHINYVINMFYFMMVHSSRNLLNLINILVKKGFKELN